MFDVRSYAPHTYFGSNMYVVSSDNDCIVVDPSLPYSRSYLGDCRVKYVILTHAHFDHMIELDSWISATGAPLLISRGDHSALSDASRNCYRMFTGREGGYYGNAIEISDDDELILGEGSVRIMESPGHTPGSIALLFDTAAIVGDTVFAGGGYGRTDLPGGDPEALVASIRAILDLPGETTLYPGHGEPTTVMDYKKYLI